jgi:hypothetical protein
VALTHSSLGRLASFADRFRRCTRLLLDAGADANQAWTPDADHRLSALYGAAGIQYDAETTRMLLAAGADPNDGESLYHSVEGSDAACTRLLLEAGARVEGSNALHHQLDRDDLDGLQLLLAYTKDANDSASPLGSPLLWAIRRRRSLAHIDALLSAGASPRARTRDGLAAYTFAMIYGLDDVAEALARAGAEEPLTVEDRFVAACASVDEARARELLNERPNMFALLSQAHLRQLPNLAEAGCTDAVRLMVTLGWPIAVRGGDWDASALNLAVFHGDAALTRWLLDHGASWSERHGFGDNVNGTLSWASRHHDDDAGDWVGCARALVEHGMPIPAEPSGYYSAAVAAYFDAARRGDRSGARQP